MWCASRRSVWAIGLTLVLLSLMVALPVDAQEAPGPRPVIEAKAVDGALAPGDLKVIPLTVSLDCTPPEASPSALPVEVALEVHVDEDWAMANLSQQKVTFDECAPIGGSAVPIAVDLAVDRTAPAGTEYQITVTASSGGRLATATWNETVGILMDATFWFERAIWKSGPNSRIEIPLTLDNAGNDLIEVSIKRLDNSSEHLNVMQPANQRVPPGERHTITVDVMTPFENGYLQQNDTLHMLVTARAESNKTAVAESVVSADVETVGTYLPGPAPLLVFLVTLGLTQAVRTVKRDPKGKSGGPLR